MRKRIVIIGATSTIAELCAREWMKQDNVEMVLVGRDAAQLKAIAQDLSVRAPKNHSETVITDFKNPAAIKKTCDEICIQGIPDIVLIAHGNLPDQKQCQEDLDACKDAMEINGLSPALFAEAFAEYLDKANKGSIAIIGSVAGDRGRQSNYIYGAAKELLARYVQGLQHRFYGRNVKVVLIKPGPTATKMTQNINLGVKLADPVKVALAIVRGVAERKAMIYVPKKWSIIMMIIRLIPNRIFGRIKI